MDNLMFVKKLVKASKSGLVNKIFLKQMDSFLYKEIVQNDDHNLNEVQNKKFRFISSMLHMAMKNVRKGYVSSYAIERLSEVLVENSFFKDKNEFKEKREEFIKENGFFPPSFVTLSPTQHCNLKCTGCYANSDSKTTPTLPFEIVNRICQEVHDLYGSRFITISGGEPFLYKSDNHTLVDIFRKYNDMFFLVYTNGTLINKEMAATLAELGNVTPAISVEGFAKETDERRGQGIHNKILEAFKNLREAGVPFGISVTATSKNVDTLLSEKFYEYYFEEQGATYMWEFQFLPIGRGKKTFDLVVSPENRLKLYNMWVTQISQKKHCIADFWNSGVLTCGCIAYGGNRGYIYIDWNGNIMPCVFVPYYINNVIDLYNNGKNLVDALKTDMMKRGRKWQDDYGLNNHKTAENWLTPCSFRDHFDNFMKNIITSDAKAENPEAQQILFDMEYYEQMSKYDNEIEELTKPVWQNEYVKHN
ncbi:MAG: radical SAM/SPASM domain-containing protein [Candidatus Cloacimonas sp.]